MKILLVLEAKAASAEKAALVFLVAVMVLLSLAQILLRLLFSQGIMWADPFLRHMVLWAGFFGAALAAREHKHFSMDIAVRIIPEQIRPLAEGAGRAAACLVSALLFWAAYKFLRDEMTAKVTLFSVGPYAVAAVWMEFMIPAGLALVFFHTALGFFRKSK